MVMDRHGKIIEPAEQDDGVEPKSAGTLREAYQACVIACERLYGEDGDEDALNFSPLSAEHEIARIRFWSFPCQSMEQVAEKVRLIEGWQDFQDELRCNGCVGDFEGGKTYSVLDLLLASLRGETLAEDYATEIREYYARELPGEIADRDAERESDARKDAERNEREREAAEMAVRPVHPEEERLATAAIQANIAWSRWRRNNRDLVSDHAGRSVMGE